ncbi:hypothetical protein HPB49_020658 [Dermacentor silvarum]|uniref:Uncharacterized protein n=1 Tax=Dermacentor silvarum TaxID=543639 RepID=A0ACB8C5B4_DERSI|nr:hypothetical protein HPB49_020658 [Dermacentor silvarum]
MDLFLPQRLAGVGLRTSESFDCEEGFGHGPFQKRMLLLVLLGTFSKPLAGFNISAADWKNIAIPTEADGRSSRCRVYKRCKPPTEPGNSVEHGKGGAGPAGSDWWYGRCFLSERELQDTNDTRDAPCEVWDYDVRMAETSAVSYWNMVCHRRLVPAALVTLQNAGAVISLILAGAFVDYVDRRAMLLGSSVAVVTCTACTFQVLFMAVMGLALCVVWILIGKPVGIDWRLKQVICLAPTALLLPALFTARESPRWLVAKGRLDEA